MAKLKLKSKDIRAIGYPEGPVISIAMNIMEKNYKFEKEDSVMNLLRKILESPVEYANDAVLGLIAQRLMDRQTGMIRHRTDRHRVHGTALTRVGRRFRSTTPA